MRVKDANDPITAGGEDCPGWMGADGVYWEGNVFGAVGRPLDMTFEAELLRLNYWGRVHEFDDDTAVEPAQQKPAAIRKGCE
jgi:hypothetical protein